MTSVEYMRKNERTLADFFGDEMTMKGSGRRAEEKARCAVRDTQETIEVMLLQLGPDENVRLLPWVEIDGQTADEGFVVPVDDVPHEAVAKAMAQSSVHLPAAMNGYSQNDDEGIDGLIDQLENGCANEAMMWQESPMLAGRLAVFLGEDDSVSSTFSAMVGDWKVSYSRGMGLSCMKLE